jgi:NAD(P)H-hydrate epimerase
MARAARAIFETVDWRPPAAIVCGSGNNAGDGYALALLLREHGIPCTAFLLKEKFSADGAYYYQQCLAKGVETRLWDGADFTGYATVVDCILGTGFHGEVKGEVRAAIEAINRSGAYVVAADINSGLDGENGLGACCVRSDLTVSIGGYQPGHFLNRAKDVMRRKCNADIGIAPLRRPYRLMERADLLPLFAARPNNSNKGSYGFTALIGGSENYPGAIRLAAMANAAMRAGAGVVRVALPRALYHELLPLILESTVFPLSDVGGQLRFDEAEAAALIQKCRTVAIGMGIGLGEGAAALLRWLLAHYTGTLIVDADGLTLLSRMDRALLRGAACRLVLTPHPGEFARLTGLSTAEVLHAPIALAEAYARDTGAIVLLKGPTTVVTDGGETWLVDTGCAGMATAGSGDVLSGISAALCAWAPDALTAAAAAAWVNGRAGELAQRRYGSITMLASDTAACIREVVSELETEQA